MSNVSATAQANGHRVLEESQLEDFRAQLFTTIDNLNLDPNPSHLFDLVSVLQKKLQRHKCDDNPTLATIDLDTVEPEDIRWLWHPYIPFGKITLLDGDPGVGKSWAAFAIASSLSTGSSLPGSRFPLAKGRTLLLAGEDGLADTVKPRMLEVGADHTMIRAATGILKQTNKTRIMLDEDGLIALRAEVESYRPQLVILDPLVAFVPSKTDTFRANEVYGVLVPLNDMAAEFGCAVLALRHLNKGGGTKALYRGQGSMAFTGIARSVLVIDRDVEDKTKLVMASAKNNLAKEGPAQAYRLPGSKDSYFHWLGPVEGDADDLMGPREGAEGRRAVKEAKDFLATFLSTGPRTVSECQNHARQAGISDASLRRAREGIGIRAERIVRGSHQAYMWTLPTHEDEKLNSAENVEQAEFPP